MGWARKIPWPEMPVWLGAAIMFAGSALLIAQVTLGAVAHGKQMKLCAALIGVEKPDHVPVSVAALLDGSYQASFARRIGTHMPYYPTAVRLRNQVEFSVFKVSPMPRMVYGTGGQLLQIEYITAYCTMNLSGFLPGAPEWAAKIRQMQGEVERRAQTFVYVITPSKVAQYPDDLPPGMPCPSSQADRTQLVPDWVALVQREGVHLVDTTSLLFAERDAYPFRMFPKGGTHWNQVASALGAQAVEAALEAQRQDGEFPPFTFSWQLSAHPAGMDTDLATLMNLFWLPAHIQAPELTFHEASPMPGCQSMKIVIVGGSFMESIGAVLSRLPCGARVVQYFYWQINRFTWKDGIQTVWPVDPELRDKELRGADVILFEENETGVGRSNHGAALYQWLRETSARATSDQTESFDRIKLPAKTRN